VWTYLYFAPHILDLVANDPTGTPTPEYLDAVRQWLFLNRFRVENYTGILFLVAAFIPASLPGARHTVPRRLNPRSSW
jgi:hypothetical protein